MPGNNLENDTEKVTFEIKGAFYKEKCFPGLNDLINARSKDFKKSNGTYVSYYGEMKKKYARIATNCMREGLKSWKATGIVIPHYYFGEPNKGNKRDYDNVVSAARKIINDALEKAGYIEKDSPDYMEYGTNTFEYVNEPYIKVVLECRAVEKSF